DVLAGPHGHHRDRGVHVVGRADDDRLHLLLVEQPTVVLVEARPGELLAGGGGAVLVHVAQGDDFFVADGGEVGGAAGGDADHAQAEAVAARRLGRGGQGGRDGGGGAEGRTVLQEVTAGQAI